MVMTRVRRLPAHLTSAPKALLTLGLLCGVMPGTALASTITPTTTSAGGPSPALLQTPWAQAMLRDSNVHAITAATAASSVTAAEVAPASTPLGPISENQIADQLLKLMARNGGVLPDNVFVESLARRRNMDPGRFDFWHPHIGAILAARTPTPVVPPTIVTAQQVVPPPKTPPPPVIQDTPPPIVHGTPEPASILVALGLVASAGWLRKRASVR